MRSASSTYASLAGAAGALAWASGALMPASLLLTSRANRGFVLGERARELVAKLVRDGDVRIRRVLVDRVELRLHYVIVQAKLYAVHKDTPDAHVTVSNELRDQLARSLAEDEAAVRTRS